MPHAGFEASTCAFSFPETFKLGSQSLRICSCRSSCAKIGAPSLSSPRNMHSWSGPRSIRCESWLAGWMKTGSHNTGGISEGDEVEVPAAWGLRGVTRLFALCRSASLALGSWKSANSFDASFLADRKQYCPQSYTFE